jgi:hypothetical protein
MNYLSREQKGAGKKAAQEFDHILAKTLIQ